MSAEKYFYSCVTCDKIYIFKENHDFVKNGDLIKYCDRCEKKEYFRSIFPQPDWIFFTKKGNKMRSFELWNEMVHSIENVNDYVFGYKRNYIGDKKQPKLKKRILDSVCQTNNCGGMNQSDINRITNLFQGVNTGKITIGFRGYSTKDKDSKFLVFENTDDGYCKNSLKLSSEIFKYMLFNNLKDVPFLIIYDHPHNESEYNKKDLKLFCSPDTIDIKWCKDYKKINEKKNKEVNKNLFPDKYYKLIWLEKKNYIEYGIEKLKKEIEELNNFIKKTDDCCLELKE